MTHINGREVTLRNREQTRKAFYSKKQLYSYEVFLGDERVGTIESFESESYVMQGRLRRVTGHPIRWRVTSNRAGRPGTSHLTRMSAAEDAAFDSLDHE